MYEPVPELFATQDARAALKLRCRDFPVITLNSRQLCDLELLLNGGFAPLTGFLGRRDYESVLKEMRLSSGALWPIPVTLDVDENLAQTIGIGREVALHDLEGTPLAVMTVTDKWQPNLADEALAVFGTQNIDHPGVHYLKTKTNPVYLGGAVQGLSLPVHYDFCALRFTPNQLRAQFQKRNWRKIIAFQTRNPMHRAHHALTMRAAETVGARLLLHPVVGMTKPGDIDYFTRVRCYRAILPRFPAQTTVLSLLNLAMRMGGPREALWHGLIRKNYGCTHFIVGRDHAGPGKDKNGRAFYAPYAAQSLFAQHEDEIGLSMVDFKAMVYVKQRKKYETEDQLGSNVQGLEISGSELRHRLKEGLDIPDWFSFPEIVAELRRSHPVRAARGFTVFFTGLSGAGKSTIANALQIKLMELGTRPVTLLDGDIVRKNLSSELGFSRRDRDLNIRRIGFVASEITKNGGVAICAPIAPYAESRAEIRQMIEAEGSFIEIHVSTSLKECERRDRKGLYAKARAGLIAEFTGISDPYEVPENPELVIDTEGREVASCVELILEKLRALNLTHSEKDEPVSEPR